MLSNWIKPHRKNSSKTQKGFTIVEVLIVVVIVGVLVVVALPTFTGQSKRAKRSDGKNYLLDLASRQERFFTQYLSYTNVIVAPASCTGAACGLGLSANLSKDGYYQVAISLTPSSCSPTGTTRCTGFQLTASPTFSDSDCPTFTYTHTGNKGPDSTEAFCWR